MPLVRDKCICVRKFEYSETSQILTLFSRQRGLLRVIARGAHRRTKAGASKFDGGLDLLEVGDAVFTLDPARDLNTLTEWSLKDGHLELRSSLRSMYLALYAGELVSLLIEEQDPHPLLFDRLEFTLGELGSPRAEEAFLAFELDLLSQSGHLPELSICVECGVSIDSAGAGNFSLRSGGVTCKACGSSGGIRLDIRLLRLAKQILKLPRVNSAPLRLPRLTRYQTDPLNRLLAEHIEHTLSKRLQMPKYVLGLSGHRAHQRAYVGE